MAIITKREALVPACIMGAFNPECFIIFGGTFGFITIDSE